MQLKTFYASSIIVNSLFTVSLLAFVAFFQECDIAFSLALSMKWQLVANVLITLFMTFVFVLLYTEYLHASPPTQKEYKIFLLVWTILLIINSCIVNTFINANFQEGIMLFVLLFLQQLYYLVSVTVLYYCNRDN